MISLEPDFTGMNTNITPTITPSIPSISTSIHNSKPLDEAINVHPSIDPHIERFFDEFSHFAPSHQQEVQEPIAEDRRAQRRPAPLRRISSHRQELTNAVRADKEKFRQDNLLVVTTSPVTPSTPTIDNLRTPTPRSCDDLIITPTAKNCSTAMSQSQNSNSSNTIDQNKLSPSNSFFPRNSIPGTSSSTSRIRNPAPPSPLSRIQPSPSDSHALPTPTSSTVPTSGGGGNLIPQSPCFIHSHLDRTGTLQDWLQGSGSGTQPNRTNGPTVHHRNGAAQMHHASSSRHPKIPVHQARQLASHAQTQDMSSAGSSRVTSPTDTNRSKRDLSMSGYESDKSSMVGGSALLDGDIMDDEDDTGSLTRQLAETAQGVREMSKQLGRTRVRSKIQSVLIVTKARDNRLIKLTRELALYLMQKRPTAPSDSLNSASSHSTSTSFHSKTEERGMIVYVDAQLRHSKRFDAAGLQQDHPEFFRPLHRRRSSSSASVNNVSSWSSGTSLSESRRTKDEGQLRYWTSEMCSTAPHLFDFVVTLGGDGTVLFTSWLFQKIVPPVLPFALGSLGFLTNFDFSHYKPTMDRVIDEGIRVNLRMRFTCTVYRAIAPEEAYQASKSGKSRKAIKKPGGEILMSTVDKKGWEALEGAASATASAPMASAASKKEKEIMCFSTRPVEQFEVLNDLVVDRGPSPFVSLLELFGDEHHLTTVQADGLTVSTPTGSTAYSLSAGGSLVHPQIPAILITPICPHTLSFRPMLLPDSMELRICVPYNSRSTAWASFDGRGRVELKQGDHIKVTASKYPFPTVCADKASPDWFNAISRTLRWNEREKQKSFVVVEEDNEPAVKRQSDRQRAEDNMASQADQSNNGVKEQEGEDSDDEDEEEEEEDYDIDDGGNTPSPNTPDASEVPPTLPDRFHPRAQFRQNTHSSHQSGVDTPDRFVTHCEPPPALSQRHLVDKLTAASAEMEISRKDNEDGQRDHIRSDPDVMRVDDGQHMIPSGRGLEVPISNGAGVEGSKAVPSPNKGRRSSHGQSHAQGYTHDQGHGQGQTRSRSQTRRPAPMERVESKAKAFAFFGQDDSASDQSEDGLQ